MKLQCSLVFYIGNGVVKGAIVSHESNKPQIRTIRVRELPHYQERDREHLEKRILFEFGELAHEIKTEDILALKGTSFKFVDATVILSSPWYISETSIIKMKEQKPFNITQQLIDGALGNIVKAYRDSHRMDIAVLEQKMIKILLNGYPTNDPIKKKVTSLDLNIFTSFARKSSIENINQIIDQYFHVKETNIHSQSLAAFSVIGSLWRDLNQYIITDITSQLTELVSVRKGILSEAASIPKGKQFLVKSVSNDLGVSTEVAESLLKMKSTGHIEENLAKKVDTALLKAQKEWLKEFSDALRVMSASSSLPNTFILFAPKDVTGIFSQFIQAEEYQQFSFAEGKFEVKEVSVADLLPYCTISPGTNQDLSIVLGSLFSKGSIKV
ncbi:MAG: hypothetical protein FGM57_01035 [Candidatus Taylorbacteria bacterium]|nr:hypothetical protein [Candidatus Taylorbacteria bacterium]